MYIVVKFMYLRIKTGCMSFLFPILETDTSTQSDGQQSQMREMGERRGSQTSNLISDRGYNSALASQNHSLNNSVGDLQSDVHSRGEL